MKNKAHHTIFLLLMTTLTLFADEVLVNQIDKKLKVINLGIFKNENRAKEIVQNFSNDNDTYTGFYKEKYYIYLVNIAPKDLNTTLENAKSIISDAYVSSKKSFEHGIILHDENEKEKEIQIAENKDENQTATINLDSNTTLPLVHEDSSKETILEEPLFQGKEALEKSLIESENDNVSYKPMENSEEKDIVYVDLLDVVLQTLSQSYKLKASREKMIQASHNIDVSYANYKPTIDFEYVIGSTQRKPGDEQQNGTFDNKKEFGDERFSIAVNQSIYSAGKNKAQASKAEIDYIIAKNDYRQVIESEILKAINAYLDVVFRRESLQANEKNIERLQTILEITKIKFDSGALSVGELSSVEASIANAMSQLSRTKSLFNNAIEFYNFITNEMFKNTYPYQKDFETVFGDLEELEKEVLYNNTRLKGFQLLIASKKEAMKLEKSSFGPKVDLQLNVLKVMDKEDYQSDEDEYSANLRFSYNIYNGGKDKANFLKAFSSIQQTIHEQEAQIREILWNLKKLHTTLSSLDESIKNNEDEVSSSRNMVDSYWEGFRYGEQDLNILLQAQRQLNTAELDMINNKLEKLVSYYKILEMSGNLINYFGLDIENDYFLDMAKGKFHEKSSKRIYKASEEKIENQHTVDHNQTSSFMDRVDANTSESLEENLSKIEKIIPFEDFIEFGEMFLIENPDHYTIVFENFKETYEALKFIKKNNIADKAYIFKTLVNEKVQTHIAYGIYISHEEAEKALSQLQYFDQKTNRVSNIGDVVNSAMQFNHLALIEKGEIEAVVKEKKIEPIAYVTDPNFKRKFLDANKDYFTINITTFQTIEDAFKVAQSQGILDSSFIFEYGDQLKVVKLMYGVFETYEEADASLDSLGPIKTHYLPVVERVGRKQALYNRYNLK